MTNKDSKSVQAGALGAQILVIVIVASVSIVLLATAVKVAVWIVGL